MTLLLTCAAFLFLACSLTPYARRSHYLTDIPSHFVLQYVVCAPAFFILCFLAGVGWPALLAIIAGFSFSLYQLRPFMRRAQKAAPPRKARILQANVYNGNIAPEAFSALIDQENPDVIAIAETNPPFRSLFEQRKTNYPYQVYKDKVSILSKTPLQEVENTPRGGPLSALIYQTVIADRPLTVLTFHTPHPFQSLKKRDLEFAEAAAWISREKPKHLVVLGDINATSYCPALQNFLKMAGLRNARNGRGILGSFPSWLPAFMRIPIDHVLVSPDITVMDYRLGSRMGSDHLPTIADISF